MEFTIFSYWFQNLKQLHISSFNFFRNSIYCNHVLYCSQEVLIWLTKLSEELGADPSDEKVRSFIWDSLKGGVSFFIILEVTLCIVKGFLLFFMPK